MGSTSAVTTEGEELREALGDATSVLLLSSDQHAESEACSSLLSAVAPEDAQYLSVTLDDTPDDRIDAWQADIGELPSEMGVISVGERSRSAVSDSSANGPGPSTVSIDSVADPSDLTGIAMAIGSYLDAWSETDRTPVICFESITSLLFHTDEERTFRFLHSTIGRLRDLGAIAHYHLARGAHDESTINMFSGLVDAVIEIDENGTVEVRKRR